MPSQSGKLQSVAGRTPKGERSSRAILEAAHELFLERGYHATSVRNIAERSGLTLGGVYAHWADKESIWRAVLDVYHPFRTLIPAFESPGGETIEQLFVGLAHLIVETLGTNRAALNLVFTEMVEFQGAHFTTVFPELFPRFVEAMRGRIAEAGAALAYPPEVIVRSFFGLIFSFFMTSVVLPVNSSSEYGSLDSFVEIYLHGILAGDRSTAGVSARDRSPTAHLDGA